MQSKGSIELWYTNPNCPVLSGNMKPNHTYYYQMQHAAPNACNKLNYCCFYIWSNGKTDNKFLVRTEKDIVFYETMMEKHDEGRFC